MNEKLFIFILTYKHRSLITSVLDRIPEKILTECEEILISDDAPINGGPRDGTKEVVINYIKKKGLRNISFIEHKKNLGYGGNQKFCYNYGIKKGYDIAIMVHGDGQYAPEKIPEIIKKFHEDNADFVFGSRMTGNPRKGGMPGYKYLGNKFLTSVENTILKTNLSEFHSGFRAYNLHALNSIPFNRLSNDYHFDSEIIVQLVLAKKKISEVTIPTHYGNEISYVNSFKYGTDILRMLLRYIFHNIGWEHPKFKIYEKEIAPIYDTHKA